VQLVITETAITERVRRAVDQTIEVIRRRVDALGTTEPNIQRQGADRVLVQVPGLQDTNRLKELLGTTARLEFRLVADPGYNPGDVDMLNELDPQGQVVTTYPVEKRVMVQGEDLTDAQPGFDQRTSEPVVNFRFNLRGGQRFGEVTSANVGKPFAIILDGKVISAPRRLKRKYSRRTISRCCCAPARCQPSSPSSRSAPSAPASARTRSTPASSRPTSPRSSSSPTC
jgi:preprotein translocase subunit SecD